MYEYIVRFQLRTPRRVIRNSKGSRVPKAIFLLKKNTCTKLNWIFQQSGGGGMVYVKIVWSEVGK